MNDIFEYFHEDRDERLISVLLLIDILRNAHVDNTSVPITTIEIRSIFRGNALYQNDMNEIEYIRRKDINIMINREFFYGKK